MKKLTEETITVSLTDLEIFLELLSAHGNDIKNPYVTDASQSLLDFLRDEDWDYKAEFEAWSNEQIKFK
jgi:hypothetical protein